MKGLRWDTSAPMCSTPCTAARPPACRSRCSASTATASPRWPASRSTPTAATTAARCSTPAAMAVGRYRLVFAVAPYFRARGVVLPEPAFIDEVPLDFGIADAQGTTTCRCWSRPGPTRPTAAPRSWASSGLAPITIGISNCIHFCIVAAERRCSREVGTAGLRRMLLTEPAVVRGSGIRLGCRFLDLWRRLWTHTCSTGPTCCCAGPMSSWPSPGSARRSTSSFSTTA